MKIALILLWVYLAADTGSKSLFSEQFIGQSKTNISESVSANFKSLKLNTGFINNTYNYLKYEDKISEITVLFFLNEKDVCSLVRIMADYSNLNDFKAELNTHYSKQTANSWKYVQNEKEYIVTMEEGDWYFTVTIKEKN